MQFAHGQRKKRVNGRVELQDARRLVELRLRDTERIKLFRLHFL